MEQERRDARTRDGAPGEPRERERTDDQALQESPQRHHEHEQHDDPVDRGHASGTLRVGGPAFRVRSSRLAVTDHERERRRRIIRRLLPAVAAVALIVGVVAGALSTPASVRAGRDFARAWEHGRVGAMYDLLTDQAKSQTSEAAFASAYRHDAVTATLRSIRVLKVRKHSGGVALSVIATTRAFGIVRGTIDVPVVDGKVAWQPYMTFPG